MGYSRTQVKTALTQAREAGKPCDGLSVGLRETELQLETWGYLPLPGDRAVDERVRDWYKAQGLVMTVPAEPAEQAPPRSVALASSDAALSAAEAALTAAQAALALARSMSPPPPEQHDLGINGREAPGRAGRSRPGAV